MRQKTQYTSMETIFSKFYRDLRGTDISESDLVEWTAEALGFMKIAEIQEEALAFIEVKDYVAEIPCGFQAVIQIARNNRWNPYSKEESSICPSDLVDDGSMDEPGATDHAFVDCNGNIIGAEDYAYYRPYFDLQYEYYGWTNSNLYKDRFTPVRLANHSFMGSLVARESNRDIYTNVEDEYTIAGGFPNIHIRTSFKEGEIALAYLRSVTDLETGYPVIPDEIEFITAITYYIKWKMAERLRWSGREGFNLEAQDAEQKWMKYMRMALNKMKMPKGIDQHQNMLEQTFYLIPNHRKYYGFFGKIDRK